VLAGIYVQKGQYDQAVIEAQRGIALDPNSSISYLWLAEVLNGLDKSADALAAAEKTMRLDPRNPDYYLFQEGWACSRLGRWAEAIPALKGYLARYPDVFWARVFLAEAYMGLGDEDAARAQAAEVQQAVAGDPNSVTSLLALAEVMNATGRPVEGLAAAEKAMPPDPRRRAGSLFMRGWAYSQLGQWKEAISVLKGLSSPNNPWPHVWLAVDYIELGHDDVARAEIAEGLRINPRLSLKAGLAAFPAEKERASADLRKAGLK
jgi:tetratricopeptide (TPR) repeat protein